MDDDDDASFESQMPAKKVAKVEDEFNDYDLAMQMSWDTLETFGTPTSTYERNVTSCAPIVNDIQENIAEKVFSDTGLVCLLHSKVDMSDQFYFVVRRGASFQRQ